MDGEHRNDTDKSGKAHDDKERETKEVQRSTLDRAAERLAINTRFAVNKVNYYSYRRYVVLERQTLFNNLVSLYEELFKSEWFRFRRFAEPHFTGTDAYRSVAAVYVSVWFHDLYVTIRDSVRKLSSIAANEHYQHVEPMHMRQYDAFLTLLNAHIRPTLIVGTPEETLWLPFIREQPRWGTENPFGITGYNCNYSLARGLVSIMIDAKRWRVEEISTINVGRPTWLFDWHNNKMYAWFKRDGNYTNEDVAIAYIIGGACTPNLGPRDVDDWQTWTNNTVPADIDLTTYDRVDASRWGGGFIVRTHNTRDLEFTVKGTVPATPQFVKRTKKRKKSSTSPSSTNQDDTTVETGEIRASTRDKGKDLATEYNSVDLHQFQIMDWTYHAELSVSPTVSSRTDAHKFLVLSE